MASIIPLDSVDSAFIEALLDRAFEPTRARRTAYKVREGTDWLPALSFAALDSEERLAGTIQCWPVALTEPAPEGTRPKRHPMIMVGPVAVLPEQQGSGFGQALMRATLGALSPEAPLPQVMIGDPEYYERFFGFSAARTGSWLLPGPWDPARLLCRTASPEVLPTRGMLGPWLA